MELQTNLKRILTLEGRLVAVSADSLQTAIQTKSSLKLSFDVLADTKRKVIQLYGILHPEENLARPAVFVIDQKGYVRFRYIGKNAADRPTNARIINALKWL